MRGLKSFEYEISNTKYSLPFAFFNRLLFLQIIGAKALTRAIPRSLTWPIIFIMALYVALPYSDAFAQHMMMPPPASVGDRKITLNFDTEPTNIISNQTLLTKLAFADQNTKQTVKHVTVRMEISESASDRRYFQNSFMPMMEISILNLDRQLV